MSRTSLESQDPENLLRESRICLQMGFFWGALERSLQLQRHPELGQSARQIAWIARTYLGGDDAHDALEMRDVLDSLNSYGGQGLAESAFLVKTIRPKAVASAILEIFKAADSQHGVIVTWHPTAILRLAEHALIEGSDLQAAVFLTSIALGHRSIFVSLEDVQRLAKLLIELEAPICLWADWCCIFIQHIRFATLRAGILAKDLHNPLEAERWSLAEDAASEEVLVSVLAQAPLEVWELIHSLALHLEVPDFSDVIKTRFSASDIAGDRKPSLLWSNPASLRYRYFWYDMVSVSEQNLVRNGDWAMFGLPTDDFSMGLSQWWRTVESVLKRSVTEQLSTLFAQNPEWADFDRTNLSPKRREKESIFIDKLAHADRAAKVTLYEILLVLEKCESTNDGALAGSRLRLEAAKFLRRYSSQFGVLTKGQFLNPAHLNQQNINWFRNRSSHDASVSLVDASIGRVLAMRILSGFFFPVLKGWGFQARLP